MAYLILSSRACSPSLTMRLSAVFLIGRPSGEARLRAVSIFAPTHVAHSIIKGEEKILCCGGACKMQLSESSQTFVLACRLHGCRVVSARSWSRPLRVKSKIGPLRRGPIGQAREIMSAGRQLVLSEVVSGDACMVEESDLVKVLQFPKKMGLLRQRSRGQG